MCVRLLNVAKSVYCGESAFLKVNGVESECFEINMGMSQSTVMSL